MTKINHIKCEYTELVDIDQLVFNPRNNNVHTNEQIDRLAKILDFQGIRKPIIVSKESGFIVTGHATTRACEKNGWTKIPVSYQSFENEAQEYAHMTADNEIARWANLDLVKMSEDVKEYADSVDIDMLGLKDFKLPEVRDLDHANEDTVPENVETRCKKGDLWILGEHRLLCGDSTDFLQVERLMDGDKADMVFTDPPYGIDYNPNGGVNATKRGDYKKVLNDDKPFDPSFIVNSNLGEIILIWGANHFASKLPDSSGWICWIKIGDGQSSDISDLELAWTSLKKPARRFNHLWRGMIKASEIGQKRVHPTQKPIALAEWCFENYGKPKSVLDLFGGSGSTLIACEKTNRKCYMMELDEHYCDVIISRWEKYTGKEAVLSDSPAD